MKAGALPSILTAAALLALLSGCQKQDERAAASSREPPQATATARDIAPLPPAGDPSLPDAATALAADDAVAGAKADAGAAGAEQTPVPRAEMTKEEESDTMPRAGQANDHSTTALDKKRTDE